MNWFNNLNKNREGATEGGAVHEYNTLKSELQTINEVKQLRSQRGWLKLISAVRGRIAELTDEVEKLYTSDLKKVPTQKIQRLLMKREAFMEFIDLFDEAIAEEPLIRRKLEIVGEIIMQANLEHQRQSFDEPAVKSGVK